MKNLTLPLTDAVIDTLAAGDILSITGTIITARDAAHKKLADLIEAQKTLPIDLEGQTVFYAGPTPAKPGKPIGSVGPTTAGRMDLYAPLLISRGLKVMIGKGLRSNAVTEAIVQHRGIYLAAIGGVAALMAQCVKSAEIIAFEELGTEAIRKLYVENLPVVVAIDASGRNVYESGRQQWQRTEEML